MSTRGNLPAERNAMALEMNARFTPPNNFSTIPAETP